jgi:hypothetical protein
MIKASELVWQQLLHRSSEGPRSAELLCTRGERLPVANTGEYRQRLYWSYLSADAGGTY